MRNGHAACSSKLEAHSSCLTPNRLQLTAPSRHGICQNEYMQAFLTAEWKDLLFVNYEVAPEVLQPYLPQGVELDLFNGKCLVSLVGFMFLKTKLRGIGFPFYRNFEEFNLRFYVLRREGNSYKRGVVFVKEIVPRRMITWVAYSLYGERYFYHPMKHTISETKEGLDVSYSFKLNGKWNGINASADAVKKPPITGTEEEFITEHYWGYTKIKNGATSEYQVHHPRWNLQRVNSHQVDIDTDALYGSQWSHYLRAEPTSVFLADGSPVTIFTRNIITQHNG